MTLPSRPLVLASGSPRRRELLEAAGFRFLVAFPDIDESALPGEAPGEMVERLAAAKAAAVAAARGEQAACILACDTTVMLEGAAFGKPATHAEAVAMLQRLSGRTHEVITGFTVVVGSLGFEETTSEVTAVTFRDLSDDEIAGYVDSGEPFGKAGAYAIQGGAGRFVAALEGLRSTVIGLPIEAVRPVLATVGVRPE